MEHNYILLVLKTNNSVNTKALKEVLARYSCETQDDIWIVKTNVSTQEFLVGIKTTVGEVEPLVLRLDGKTLSQGILPSQLQSFVMRSQAA